MSQEPKSRMTTTCDCLTELPVDLKNNLNKTDEYKGAINKIRFKDLSWTTVNWQILMRLSTTLELDISTRKTPKKLPLFFNYCPFCGVKYE